MTWPWATCDLSQAEGCWRPVAWSRCGHCSYGLVRLLQEVGLVTEPRGEDDTRVPVVAPTWWDEQESGEAL